MRTPAHWKVLVLEEVAGSLWIGERTAPELTRIGRPGGATKVDGSWRVLKEELDRCAHQGGGAGMQGAPE